MQTRRQVPNAGAHVLDDGLYLLLGGPRLLHFTPPFSKASQTSANFSGCKRANEKSSQQISRAPRTGLAGAAAPRSLGPIPAGVSGHPVSHSTPQSCAVRPEQRREKESACFSQGTQLSVWAISLSSCLSYVKLLNLANSFIY